MFSKHLFLFLWVISFLTLDQTIYLGTLTKWAELCFNVTLSFFKIITASNDFMKFAPDCVVKIVSKEWTMPVTVLGVNLCEKLCGASVLRNAVSPLRDCRVSSGSVRQLCNLPCFSFFVGCREAQR